jgi:hypothetical protein
VSFQTAQSIDRALGFVRLPPKLIKRPKRPSVELPKIVANIANIAPGFGNVNNPKGWKKTMSVQAG